MGAAIKIVGVEGGLFQIYIFVYLYVTYSFLFGYV